MIRVTRTMVRVAVLSTSDRKSRASPTPPLPGPRKNNSPLNSKNSFYAHGVAERTRNRERHNTTRTLPAKFVMVAPMQRPGSKIMRILRKSGSPRSFERHPLRSRRPPQARQSCRKTAHKLPNNWTKLAKLEAKLTHLTKTWPDSAKCGRKLPQWLTKPGRSKVRNMCLSALATLLWSMLLSVGQRSANFEQTLPSRANVWSNLAHVDSSLAKGSSKLGRCLAQTRLPE